MAIHHSTVGKGRYLWSLKKNAPLWWVDVGFDGNLAKLRAHIYRYRHCLYFEASLEGDMTKQVRTLMKKQKCDEALTLIKQKALIIYIPEEKS